jgi:hypothetical protein
VSVERHSRQRFYRNVFGLVQRRVVQKCPCAGWAVVVAGC